MPNMGPYPGDTTLELKDIRAIIDLMKKNDLAVFKLEKEGFKIELEAHRHPAPLVSVPYEQQGMSVTPALGRSGAGPVDSPVVAPEAKNSYREIVSPMVGTFYRAPSPDSAPYIKEGQEVSEETVVCIIEAMKVMNEIKAEVTGEIVEVLVENGTAVQFGQPLFRVK
jgi:acetyl-CoA carboxylase biotin carboxyl carrier protein